MPSTISAGTTAGTAIAVAGDTTGNLAFQTNGTTTAMTIDTSQNVGVGTTSPVSLGTGYGTVDVRGSNGGGYRWGSATNNSYTYSDSGGLVISTANALPLILSTNNTEQARITSAGLMQFNSGYGSVATAFGCRAWVNFNGTGTVAIRASGNVSSITDNGTGDYTVNFTTAMPDANYAVSWSGNGPTVGDYNNNLEVPYTSTPTTSAIRVFNKDNNQAGAVGRDVIYGYLAAFR